jgi:hypothetical protein
LSPAVIQVFKQRFPTAYMVSTNAAGTLVFLTENRVTAAQQVVHRFGEGTTTEAEKDAVRSGELGPFFAREWTRLAYPTQLREMFPR